MLLSILFGLSMSCVSPLSILHRSKVPNNLLLDSAACLGVPLYYLNDNVDVLKDEPEEYFVMIEGNTPTLINKVVELDLKEGVILTAGSSECLSNCNKYKTANLKGQYPYLDSTIVIGRGSDLQELLLSDMSGLHSSLTDMLLSGGSVVVDSTGDIILPINNNNLNQVELKFEDKNSTLIRKGNAPSLVFLSEDSLSSSRLFNEISRYAGNGITKTTCNACTRNNQIPSLFVTVHIQRHYPFLSNLFKSLENIPYNKSQIQILVVTSLEIELDELINSEGFASVEVIKIEDLEDEEHEVKHAILELFSGSHAEYWVYIDSSVYITPFTIPDLLSFNKPVITPMVTRRNGTALANFWGTFLDSWNYKRSSDYANIFTKTVKGVMPVACIRNMYVIERSVALQLLKLQAYDNHIDADISFCKTAFENGIPLHLSNLEDYGCLKDESTTLADLELSGEYLDDWRDQYTNQSPLKKEAFSEVCKNVFLHKAAFTPNFGKDMIVALDTIGRIYKNKPKHLDRPGYETSKSKYSDVLTAVADNLTRSVISELFPGYEPKGELYDSWLIEVEGVFGPRRSTERDNPAAYHVLVQLNQLEEDPSSNGYRFPRQDCTVTGLQPGDLLIFPGFITHQKEALAPKEGMQFFLEFSFDKPY